MYAHAVRVMLETDAGRADSAEDEAREAVAIVRELGVSGTWSAGAAHHALGQTLLVQGQYGEAERELERARTLRHVDQPRLDTTHTLIILAKARIARGRLTLAAAELSAARGQMRAFTDAGRLPLMLKEVEEELEPASLEHRQPPSLQHRQNSQSCASSLPT